MRLLTKHNLEKVPPAPKIETTLFQSFSSYSNAELCCSEQYRTPTCPLKERSFFFFFTLVTSPRRSLSLKLSDTIVYEPQIRDHSGGSTCHPELSTVIFDRESLLNLWRRTVNLRRPERAWNEGSTGPKRLDDTRCKTYNFERGWRPSSVPVQFGLVYRVPPPEISQVNLTPPHEIHLWNLWGDTLSTRPNWTGTELEDHCHSRQISTSSSSSLLLSSLELSDTKVYEPWILIKRRL